MKLKLTLSSLALMLILSACEKETKVACLGDSITEGAGVAIQSTHAYPSILAKILGQNYTVLNCGRSGATLLKKSDLPIWNCNEFSNVFAFKPNTIVIKLGTNDSKDFNWNAPNFSQDFQKMLDTLSSISTVNKIFVCLPLPAFKREWCINDSTIHAGVIPIIKKLERNNYVHLIDLNTPFLDKPELLPDGIHPNEKGAALMAEIIAKEISK